MSTLAHLQTPTPNAPALTSRKLKGCWFWAGWEPDRYYRRIGARETLFFGNGDWIPGWRARLESTDCLQAVKQAGASVLITRFSKGFGPEVDGRDWDSLQRFVKLAHANDLQVWGYLQGQSLFGEFLFSEKPEAADWVARTFEGSRRTWGGAYNRFAPCLSSGGYREMVESLVENGLGRIGLDGLHLDNSYYAHCYCPRCKSLFRRWLQERGDLEARTGILRADCVEPPPLPGDAVMLPDPLTILWIEFGVEQRLKFFTAIRKKMVRTASQAHLTGNPAFLRVFSSRLTHGYDAQREHEAFDSLCIENGNRPRFAHGGLQTQADKHLMAEAGKLRTWVTSWGAAKDTGHAPPSDAQSLWAGLAEEFSFSAAYLGNNWALRPLGDAEGMLMDSPLWEEFHKATRYFQSLEETLHMDFRQWGEIAVYTDPRALSLCPASDSRVFQATLSECFRRRVVFKILFPGETPPPETKTILMISQRSASQEELDRLSSWAGAKSERRLFLLGRCATHDEWMVPRGASLRRRFLERANVQGVTLHPGLEQGASSKKYFHGHTPVLAEEGRSDLARFLERLTQSTSIYITAPDGVLANIEISEDSHRLIHLRDLREGELDVPDRAVQIVIRDLVEEAEAFSPTWPPALPLSLRKTPTESIITLPKFRHYAGIRVRHQFSDIHIKK